MSTEHVTIDLADLRKAAEEADDWLVPVPAWLVLELLDERQQLRAALEQFADPKAWWDNGMSYFEFQGQGEEPCKLAQRALGPVIEREAPPF